jgi:hypothetical protein
VDRAINDLEEDGEGGPDAPRERKVYVGMHPAENLPLPDEAREYVQQRAHTFEDAEAAANALESGGPTGAVGWDAETALEDEREQAGDRDDDAEG